jgi:hypothetical protein
MLSSSGPCLAGSQIAANRFCARQCPALEVRPGTAPPADSFNPLHACASSCTSIVDAELRPAIPSSVSQLASHGSEAKRASAFEFYAFHTIFAGDYIVQPPVSVFDLTALEAVSNDCRAMLMAGPDNLALRLRLAWCLFMLALHQSGRETAITESGPALRNAPVCPDNGLGQHAGRSSAGALLRDCLQHNNIVRHLATDDEDRKSADRLHSLALLSGATAAAHEAEVDCRRRFQELIREVEFGIDTPLRSPS